MERPDDVCGSRGEQTATILYGLWHNAVKLQTRKKPFRGTGVSAVFLRPGQCQMLVAAETKRRRLGRPADNLDSVGESYTGEAFRKGVGYRGAAAVLIELLRENRSILQINGVAAVSGLVRLAPPGTSPGVWICADPASGGLFPFDPFTPPHRRSPWRAGAPGGRGSGRRRRAAWGAKEQA